VLLHVNKKEVVKLLTFEETLLDALALLKEFVSSELAEKQAAPPKAASTPFQIVTKATSSNRLSAAQALSLV